MYKDTKSVTLCEVVLATAKAKFFLIQVMGLPCILSLELPLFVKYVFTYVLLFQSTLDDIVSNQLNAKHDNSTRFREHEH